MESLGQYLKKERERRGIKIEEISRQTNIGSAFLEALEEDNYEDLPGEVFVRGFLRSYSNVVGLNAEEVLNRHVQAIGSRPRPVPLTQTHSIGSNYFVLKFYFFIFLFLGLLAYGGYQGFSFVFGPESASRESSKFIYYEPDIPVREETPLPGETADAGALLEGPSEIGVSAGSSSEESGSALSLNEAGLEGELRAGEEKAGSHTAFSAPHKLVITAHQDTWLYVTIDGEIVKDMILRKGESIEWTANERFNITTGNAHGTKLEFDGKPVDLPSTSTNVVRNFTLPPVTQEGDYSG